MEAVDTADTEVEEEAPKPPVTDADPADGDDSGGLLTPEPEASASASASASRSRRWVPWAIAAILAVVTLVSLLVAANAQSDSRADRRDRENAMATATRLATALSTYDHRDFEASKRRVHELATGAFLQDYDDKVGGLAEVIRVAQATSEAVVRDVFISEIEDGRARALVHYDIRGSGVGGTRLQLGNWVDLSLVKVEGRWLVDGVQNLNLQPPQQGASAGSTPTSTP